MALTLIGITQMTGSGIVPVPAGTQNGDILIVCAGHQGAATVPTVPAAFTALDNTGGASGPGAVTGWRVASSEPSSYTFTNGNTGWMETWRGQDTTTPINGHTLLRTASGTSCPSTNLTTTVNGCQLLWLAVSGNSGTYTQPAGYTLESTATDFSAAADISQTSAGSAGTPTGSQINTAHQVALIALAPAVSAPTNTVAPVVSGTTVQGNTLSATNGTWADAGGSTFTYQWQRDNSGGGVYGNIASATSSTYLLTATDVGCNVRCVVTDTDSTTLSGSANSNSVGLITAPAPSGYHQDNIEINIGIGI